MNRLEMLCVLNNQQGGTIHEFNNGFGCDFLSLTESEFKRTIQSIFTCKRIQLLYPNYQLEMFSPVFSID